MSLLGQFPMFLVEQNSVGLAIFFIPYNIFIMLEISSKPAPYVGCTGDYRASIAQQVPSFVYFPD